MDAKMALLNAVREWLLACVVDTTASTGSSSNDRTEQLAPPPPVAKEAAAGTGRIADLRAESHSKSPAMPCKVEL